MDSRLGSITIVLIYSTVCLHVCEAGGGCGVQRNMWKWRDVGDNREQLEGSRSCFGSFLLYGPGPLRQLGCSSKWEVHEGCCEYSWVVVS